MKTKILLVSILTILLCISVIAGSTYALFAQEAQVNIAVTAGQLDITRIITEGDSVFLTDMTGKRSYSRGYFTDEMDWGAEK